MKEDKWQHHVADRVSEVFSRHGAKVTLGGEPTYVPLMPEGPEWNYSAVGPTKLGYAREMARHLLKNDLPGGVDFFSPGKSYPGEVNPRWAIRLIANRNGRPIFRARSRAAATAENLTIFRKTLLAELGVRGRWGSFKDPLLKSNRVWALLIDETHGEWTVSVWPDAAKELTKAEGPGGLRLPLHELPEGVARRALTIEWKAGVLSIFMPPFLQKPFLKLLTAIEQSLRAAGIGRVEMQGYVPPDEAGVWTQVGLAADPGVLEVNLPACFGWKEYDHWIKAVTRAAESCGLRSWKEFHGSLPEGTGGGNHLLWGGPSVEENPFFHRPGWLASILRYWQRHPSLAYMFTGCYVGASSQAPRADESARDRQDLEMAWTFLETLGAGDHRILISETLRHLQTDVTGNSHRSEVSLDKFWNVGWPAGTLGLIEFRAIESLPKADWMSAVALLWSALGAWLLEKPVSGPLEDFTGQLHDRFFLPSVLWSDLAEILSDLRKGGFAMDEEIFREIWDWKFPVLLDFEEGGARLVVRKAHESWPLLCETPVDGGTTSRFVDTSMQRLELWVNEEFAKRYTVRIANRPLPFKEVDGQSLAGIRFRRTNLYPSLHPGLPPQMPLSLSVVGSDRAIGFLLEESSPLFRRTGTGAVLPEGRVCKPGRRGDLTCDLRIR